MRRNSTGWHSSLRLSHSVVLNAPGAAQQGKSKFPLQGIYMPMPMTVPFELCPFAKTFT
jgi:hypothetical protein